MKNYLFIIFLFFLSEDVWSQTQYDTLYIFPDSVIFYNQSVTLLEDISNIAVKFTTDSDWVNYKIEKLIISIPDGYDTSSYETFKISIGNLPEDSILFFINVFNIPSFPETRELIIDPPIYISNNQNFYVSGILNLSISEPVPNGIPDVFAYWWLNQQWIDNFPIYFNIKTIISKHISTIDSESNLVNNFIIDQNFPNPFNSITQIPYTIDTNGKISLEIFNILGKKIYSREISGFSRGTQVISINLSSCESGVYFYRIKVNDKISSTKKMILMK